MTALTSSCLLCLSLLSQVNIGAVFLRANKMKRVNNLWSTIISFENLHQAYINARRGKQNREAVAKFSFNLEGENLDLFLRHRLEIESCTMPLWTY